MAEPLVRMVRVESSSIDSVGYDEARKRLIVRFLGSGRTYAYHGVDVATFKALLDAPSKGSYLNTEIKGAFPYERL